MNQKKSFTPCYKMKTHIFKLEHFILWTKSQNCKKKMSYIVACLVIAPQKTKKLKIKKNDISSFIIYIFLTLSTSA
jgi:hypothetical protein